MRSIRWRGDRVRGGRHLAFLGDWLKLPCVLLVTSVLLGADQAEVTRERLYRAKTDTESKLQAAEAALLKRFDDLIERNMRDGKLEQMKSIEAAKEAFEAEGVLPELTVMTKSVETYRKSREIARKQLLLAYKAAIRDYTKDGHRDEAERVQVELDQLATELDTGMPQPQQIEIVPAPGELDPRGRPINYQPGQVAAVAIWVDEQGVWHLRASPVLQGRILNGKITVRDGRWVNVAPINTIQGKAADSGGLVNPTTFVFQFRTPAGGEDGIDFLIEGPDAVLIFEVSMRDRPFPPRRILIGREGKNPTGPTFELSNRFVVRRSR